MEYHEKRAKSKSLAGKKKRQSKENQNNTSVADFLNKEPNDMMMNCEFFSEKYIEEEKLVPKKVLNITHVKDDEKNLVVQIRFEGASEPAFVYAKWANEHCPQLVIAYYEKRIFWEKQS